MSPSAHKAAGRPDGGQFTGVTHAEGAVQLAVPSAGTPVYAQVRFLKEAGTYSGHLDPAGACKFDAAPILHGMSGQDREALMSGHGTEALYHEAVRRGLAPAHDGPFELDVAESLEEAVASDPDLFDTAQMTADQPTEWQLERSAIDAIYTAGRGFGRNRFGNPDRIQEAYDASATYVAALGNPMSSPELEAREAYAELCEVYENDKASLDDKERRTRQFGAARQVSWIIEYRHQAKNRATREARTIEGAEQ